MRFTQLVTLVAWLHAGWPLAAQTTQALVFGQVWDSEDATPVQFAEIELVGDGRQQRTAARTGTTGQYLLPPVSPGIYRLRVSAAGYQPQQMHELVLPVAGFVGLDFRLRPLSDVWESGQYRSLFPQGSRAILTFFGPDVDPGRSAAQLASRSAHQGVEPALSDVIDPGTLRAVPLAGRDAYTMLALLPGITTDLSTARGLGLSMNGGRPSSSSFLLDGTENNNYLTSGPLTTIAPEALQEYRISRSNYSAEYGRTAGYVANAVTLAGSNRWHGLGYFYLKNDVLAANGFQQNRQGIPRAPLKEAQPGLAVSGPLKKDSLYGTATFEYLRRRGRSDPVTVELPTTAYPLYTTPESLARRLLDPSRSILPVSARMPTAQVNVEPPAALDRWQSLARVDKHLKGGHRVMGRAMAAQQSQPQFIWTPYPDFVSGMKQAAMGAGVAGTTFPASGITQETRVQYSGDDLHWDRAKAEVPTLTAHSGLLLPGSPAFYAYKNRGHRVEVNESLLWTRGPHILKGGGGFLYRRIGGYLTAGRDGRYQFPDFLNFALGWPTSYEAAAARGSADRLLVPEYGRQYRNNQFFLFAQDDWRVRSGVLLSLGARYENYGVPVNTGPEPDTLVELGAGSTLPESLASARLARQQPGTRALYSSDRNNAAVRAGFSALLGKGGRTLARGAYGIFFDRPFDNLWQNLRSNSIGLVAAPIRSFPTDYLIAPQEALDRYSGSAVRTGFPEPALYQPGIRDAYVQSYFIALERRLGQRLHMEAAVQGALGRKLITTDKINRPGSVAPSGAPGAANPLGRYNASLTTLSYRANEGLSNFHGLSLSLRRSTGGLQIQASYTWSHSIDNQSDALQGDFFDLGFTRLNFADVRTGISAFSRQFDSQSDRGNSDFDQRHNAVGWIVWSLPEAPRGWIPAALGGGWRIAGLSAIRSGFPYTVLAAQTTGLTGETFYNRRADLVDAGAAVTDRDAPGGRQLLNPAAFRAPVPGKQGSTGRNAFRGPGLYSVDLSVSKSIRLAGPNETRRVTLRADFFNILNHANLNNPDPVLNSGSFGIAEFGRLGRTIDFPGVQPLDESARVVQLLLRVEF
jgi:hypothetical protein